MENKPLYEQYRREITALDDQELARINRPFTWWGRLISSAFFIMSFFALWHFTLRSGRHWYLLGGIMFIYSVIKFICAIMYRPSRNELTQDYQVSVILTCYNEKPESLVMILENIANLDYNVKEILFIDDGSDDTSALDIAHSFADAHFNTISSPNFSIHRFEENQGKRQALKKGIPLATGDYVFLLDSDSQIRQDALTELLRPFEDGETTSVVGHIGVLNKNKFLKKLQEVTYFAAFQIGRTAQSITGSTVICSGAFSIHKKENILKMIDKFDEEKIFGIRLTSGDDRSMTSFSQKTGGKTRYQATAYCETEVPVTWQSFVRQRRRWQRSTYIGGITTFLRVFPRRPIYLFWVFGESYLWVVSIIIYVYYLTQRDFIIDYDLIDIILFWLIMTYKHNIFYALYKPLYFIIMPLYSLVYGLFLIFIRIYALITITNDKWGTRQKIANEEEHTYM